MRLSARLQFPGNRWIFLSCSTAGKEPDCVTLIELGLTTKLQPGQNQGDSVLRTSCDALSNGTRPNSLRHGLIPRHRHCRDKPLLLLRPSRCHPDKGERVHSLLRPGCLIRYLLDDVMMWLNGGAFCRWFISRSYETFVRSRILALGGSSYGTAQCHQTAPPCGRFFQCRSHRLPGGLL